MQQITILYNTYPIAFDCPGGGEVQLLQYEKYLQDLGVCVVRYDPWNPQAQLDSADIVHYFSVMGSSWLFCRHVAEVRKKPLVISPIVWIDKAEKYNLQEIGWLLGMARKILPNSQAECDQLSNLFGMAPSLFTPIVNGVDDVFFAKISPALFRETYNIHDPFVLCMGNIEERKNQLRLIQAMRDCPTHLVIIGQERDAAYAAQCKAAAGERVHFLDKLEHGSTLQRSAYAAAEVLALPSTLETPGLAALEAGAAGCRLALTKEGCTEEYFGNNAFYLDPFDTMSIAQAVRQALDAPRNPHLSQYIATKFTWKHAAQQLVSAYESILEDKKHKEC